MVSANIATDIFGISCSQQLVLVITVERVSIKACSNEANMLVQHHPILFDATCWPRLNTMSDDVGRR